MSHQSKVYVKVRKISDEHFVTLESLIVIALYEYCSDDSDLELVLVEESALHADNQLLKMQQTKCNVKTELESEPNAHLLKYCTWPLVLEDHSTVIAGLCSVSRRIVKGSPVCRHLLGFREACLIACNETSIWTKFCEIDLVKTVKDFIEQSQGYEEQMITLLHLPDDLLRFEYHMSQPVRVHNLYKLARKLNTVPGKEIINGCPIEELDIEHVYAEGCSITLADLILYVLYDVLFNNVFTECLTVLQETLPLTTKWYKLMKERVRDKLSGIRYVTENTTRAGRFANITAVKLNDMNIPRESLYKSDPNRFKPQKRPFTKQPHVEAALEQIEKQPGLAIANHATIYGDVNMFNWTEVPELLWPEGGALPAKRAARKRSQLDSLACSVCTLVDGAAVGEHRVIVDFCSGSGHLGLLLAFLLPHCTLILVENKERSLQRARERATTLHLSNVVLLQSNLDYFCGAFDVGVALHACGVATDLVIEHCVRQRAHFVVCPCCYGSIKCCHTVTYPRSGKFRDTLEYGAFLCLAHGADQTHEVDNAKTKQGFACMDAVDTDRKLYAEEAGYEVVFLGKLAPPDCTPKNNLLVGVWSSTGVVDC